MLSSQRALSSKSRSTSTTSISKWRRAYRERKPGPGVTSRYPGCSCKDPCRQNDKCPQSRTLLFCSAAVCYWALRPYPGRDCHTLEQTFQNAPYRHCARRSSHFSTSRLFFTLNAPCTPLAAISAMFLSPSLATTPSSVMFPFLTMIWIGGTAPN